MTRGQFQPAGGDKEESSKTKSRLQARKAVIIIAGNTEFVKGSLLYNYI